MTLPIGNKKRIYAIRYMLSAKKGFTLLELLIVVFIISIVLGLSMPVFRKTFSDMKLNASAQDIVSLLRYAQERSIVEGAIFRLNLDTAKGEYWLTKARKEEAKRALSFDKVTGNFGRRYSIPDELVIETKAVNAVDCYPDGEITAATITFSNANKKSFSIVTTPNVGSGVTVIENAQE